MEETIFDAKDREQGNKGTREREDREQLIGSSGAGDSACLSSRVRGSGRMDLLARFEPTAHPGEKHIPPPSRRSYNWPIGKMPGKMTSGKESFIPRWQRSSASERANYALFLSELCDYLDLPRPEPSQADESLNTYVIDKAVGYKELDGSTTPNFIDLYRRSCFVLEAKQGSNPTQEALFDLTPPQPARKMKRGTAVRGTHGWDTAMLKARGQAERYAKALPASEGWPPFLIVVDVGHSIELFADFSLTGKAYLPFPGPRNFRILLEELESPEIRQRLRAVWLDPHSLDPSRERARVTREVAGKLATLARVLEQKYAPKEVAEFLTRCIFTSFAETSASCPTAPGSTCSKVCATMKRTFLPSSNRSGRR